MIKYSETLAEWTNRVLKERNLSRRQAQSICKVSYSLVDSMTKGQIPGADHIIRFAYTFEPDNIAGWLDICEYPDIADIFRKMQGKGPPGNLDALLDVVPEHSRRKANIAARAAIQAVILPLLTEAA